MNSGIKRQLRYLLSLEEKLLLHKIIASNLITTCIQQVTQYIPSENKIVNHDILKLTHDTMIEDENTMRHVTLTLFSPCIHAVDPTRTAEEMLSVILDVNKRYLEVPMIIKDDGIDRYVIRIPHRLTYKRVNNNLPISWYTQEESSDDHCIRIGDMTIHIHESSGAISASTTNPVQFVLFYIPDREFITPHPHPLIQKAIEIVLASRDNNFN